MKKIMMWLLTVMLLTGGFAAAENMHVPKAGGFTDPAALALQHTVCIDAANGVWSARTYQADAALDWFWEDGSRTEGPVMMLAELEGSTETGLVTPVLRVYHMVEAEQEPVQVVSVLLGEVRHDFAVTSRFIKLGNKMAEVLSAPLDHTSLQLIDDMIGCEAASVRLIGDGIVTVKISAKSTATKARIEYTGFAGMAQAKVMLEQAGMYEYALWDLNAAAWETRYGAAPVYQSGTVSKVIGTAETTDAFGMVRPGTAGTVAAAVQQLLREAGFMVGGDEKNVNNRVTSAVLRAQKHYGMLLTGCMDGTLAAYLTGAAVPADEKKDSADGMQLGGMVEITLGRFWTADAVSAQRAEKADRMASNSDRCLIAADGMMRNLSNDAIRLMIDTKATLVLDGQARYDAMIVCECDDGSRLDTQMMAREQARVIVYAEIPQQLLETTSAQWTLEVTAGGETAVFALE